jgi:lycopene cyclase domain-containing protein
MIFGIIILLLAYRYNPGLLSSFYLTFLVMLIPFFIVNGILTGTGIENEVVWYNNDENLGIRMLTIPIEDSVFAFSLILLNLLLFKKLKQFDV